MTATFKTEDVVTSNDQKITATKKFRMVAIDLDGTLLGSEHKISNRSVDYLRSLHKKGFIICIATGR